MELQVAPSQMPGPEGHDFLKKLRGKRYAALGLVLAVVLLGVIGLVGGQSGRTHAPRPAAGAPRVLTTSFGQTPMHYANGAVYDACSLLTLDTVKMHVGAYQSILGNLGTDKVASDPLTLEHDYIDRDIPAALGSDAQPRAAGLTTGPSAFASVFDSHCVYGQGTEVGKQTEFASVYVTQPPTPLSAEFLAYLASLGAHKQSYAKLDVYPVAPSGNDAFFSVLLVPHDKSLAVILRTANKDLAAAGADEIGKKLAAVPSGPLAVAYPRPYAQLVSPCKLLSAQDFSEFSGKPPSALAAETLYLTDVNALTVAEALHPLVSAIRTCQRTEVDHSTADSITRTNVTLRQFRNTPSAKKYLQDQEPMRQAGLRQPYQDGLRRQS